MQFAIPLKTFPPTNLRSVIFGPVKSVPLPLQLKMYGRIDLSFSLSLLSSCWWCVVRAGGRRDDTGSEVVALQIFFVGDFSR